MSIGDRTFQAVAWDIDGTLVDSEPLHQRSFHAVCERHAVDISDLGGDHFVGVSVPDIWSALRARFPADMQMHEWVGEIDGHFCAHASEVEPMPRAREVVRALAGAGLVQATVSNSSRSIVDANLATLDLADTFQFSLSIDDVPAGKPDPAPYLMAAERLQVAPANIIAVEDSPTGMRSAKAAGCLVIGYGPLAGSAADADLVATGLETVIDVAQGLAPNGR